MRLKNSRVSSQYSSSLCLNRFAVYRIITRIHWEKNSLLEYQVYFRGSTLYPTNESPDNSQFSWFSHAPSTELANSGLKLKNPSTSPGYKFQVTILTQGRRYSPSDGQLKKRDIASITLFFRVKPAAACSRASWWNHTGRNQSKFHISIRRMAHGTRYARARRAYRKIQLSRAASNFLKIVHGVSAMRQAFFNPPRSASAANEKKTLRKRSFRALLFFIHVYVLRHHRALRK